MFLFFGGVYVGYLVIIKKFIRKMFGRICGVIIDVDGKCVFVLIF